MTATKALFGLSPARMRGSSPNSSGSDRYRIANTQAADIYQGDAVKVSVGTIKPITTTTDKAVGVFLRATWVDPTTKIPQFNQHWPASTSSADATPYAMVIDDPKATFFVQADASVSLGDVGLNFDLTLGSGSNFTGQSGFGLKAASRKSTTAMVQVIDVMNAPGNAFSDAFPIVEVKWVQHVDSYTSAAY